MDKVSKLVFFELTLKTGDVIVLSDEKEIILGTELNIISKRDKHIYWGTDNKRYVAAVFRAKQYEKIFSDQNQFYLVNRTKNNTLLDSAEKNYLKKVLSPYKIDKEIIYISKTNVSDMEQIFIKVNGANMQFPPFEKGKMYKNLETNVSYTAEELCIFD
jgi:hypothetical protein